jgi:hypothetical protein
VQPLHRGGVENDLDRRGAGGGRRVAGAVAAGRVEQDGDAAGDLFSRERERRRERQGV